MKIAVTSDGPTINNNVEERFQRWFYFLIVDSDTMEIESIQNQDTSQEGDIWIKSAKFLAEKGVSILLAGNCDTNTINTFKDLGIQVIARMNGRVQDVVEHFIACIHPPLRLKCQKQE
jgi:predicted Fe-Mo cluster-binding NifX family protein